MTLLLMLLVGCVATATAFGLGVFWLLTVAYGVSEVAAGVVAGVCWLGALAMLFSTASEQA